MGSKRPRRLPCEVDVFNPSALLCDVVLEGTGLVIDSDVDVEEVVVVVGTGSNVNVGVADATLQNCCASVSDVDTWSAQFARMHATSSLGKWGLQIQRRVGRAEIGSF